MNWFVIIFVALLAYILGAVVNEFVQHKDDEKPVGELVYQERGEDEIAFYLKLKSMEEFKGKNGKTARFVVKHKE